MQKLNNYRNNHWVRIIVIALLLLLVIFLYFRNVNISNLNSVDGVKQELGQNYKPDTLDKKILLGAGALLSGALGFEASQNDWDLKKLKETGSFAASKVIRDKSGNILTEEDLKAGKTGKYTDEYNCSDFKTQIEAQAFYDKAGGVQADTNRLDGNKDGTPCQALPKGAN